MANLNFYSLSSYIKSFYFILSRIVWGNRSPKLIVLLSLLSSTLECVAQSSIIDTTATAKLRIDPSAAVGNKVSDIFAKVTFIPLETNKQSIFGTINQLEISDSCFVIYDRDTESILIFSKAGKFVSKINLTKLLASEGIASSARFVKFNIGKFQGSECILVQTRKYLYTFDFKAIQLEKIESAARGQNAMFEFKDGLVAKTDYYNKEEKRYYGLSVVRKDISLAQYFPFPENWKSDASTYTVDHSPFYGERGRKDVWFLRPMDYNIYNLEGSVLRRSYSLTFPSINSFPIGFYNNKTYVGKRLEFFDLNKKKIYSLGFVYNFGNQLFFKTATRGGLDGNNSFVYNFKNKRLTSINHIQPDAKSYFLPITDDGVSNEFEVYNFYASDGENLYTHLSSATMLLLKKKKKSSKVAYDSSLQKFFDTNDKKSNPVLIQLLPLRL